MRRGAARGIKGELWKGSEDKHSRSRKMKKWAAHAEAGRPRPADQGDPHNHQASGGRGPCPARAGVIFVSRTVGMNERINDMGDLRVTLENWLREGTTDGAAAGGAAGAIVE